MVQCNYTIEKQKEGVTIKYYAVYKGRKTGIYESWDECNKQVDRYSGAIYKSFHTQEEAEDWLEKYGMKVAHHQAQANQARVVDEEHNIHLFTDGSYDSHSETYSWAYVLVEDGKVLLYHSGKKHAGEDNMWQVSGEIEAVLRGLDACAVLNIDSVAVNYDLINLQKWADYEWKARKTATKIYQNTVAEYRKLGMVIDFQKVKAHTGTKYNELADYLAKKELGIEKHDNMDSIRGMLREDS